MNRKNTFIERVSPVSNENNNDENEQMLQDERIVREMGNRQGFSNNEIQMSQHISRIISDLILRNQELSSQFEMPRSQWSDEIYLEIHKSLMSELRFEIFKKVQMAGKFPNEMEIMSPKSFIKCKEIEPKWRRSRIQKKLKIDHRDIWGYTFVIWFLSLFPLTDFLADVSRPWSTQKWIGIFVLVTPFVPLLLFIPTGYAIVYSIAYWKNSYEEILIFDSENEKLTKSIQEFMKKKRSNKIFN